MIEKKDTRRTAIYVDKAIHRRVKLYCLKHDIPSMKAFVDGLLDAAVTKPDRQQRLERAASELTPEQRAEIDREMDELRNGLESEKNLEC